jgi:hypothetical protein
MKEQKKEHGQEKGWRGFQKWRGREFVVFLYKTHALQTQGGHMQPSYLSQAAQRRKAPLCQLADALDERCLALI